MGVKEVETLESFREKAEDSVKLVHYRPFEYFLRAMMAGFFIGFSALFTFKAVNPMFLDKVPYTGLVGGFIFGVALVLIIYGGAELFTGNTMYFTSSSLRGHTSITETLSVWGMCFLGNALGGFLFCLLVVPTHIIQDMGMNNWLFSVVAAKQDHTALEIFTRGILCNWLVCLAIFIPKQMKNEMASVFSMMLIVCMFFVSGLEHCIANLTLFSMASLVPHPETITLDGSLHNLFFATLGNIIGGGVFMGGLYTWLNIKGFVVK